MKYAAHSKRHLFIIIQIILIILHRNGPLSYLMYFLNIKWTIYHNGHNNGFSYNLFCPMESGEVNRKGDLLIDFLYGLVGNFPNSGQVFLKIHIVTGI